MAKLSLKPASHCKLGSENWLTSGLPVDGNQLTSHSPKEYWLIIRARNASTFGVNAGQMRPIVLHQVFGSRFDQFGGGLFAKRKHFVEAVRRNFAESAELGSRGVNEQGHEIH
jgi:hypothetical protein